MIRSPSSSTKELNQHECSFLSLILWLTGGGTGGRTSKTDIETLTDCLFFIFFHNEISHCVILGWDRGSHGSHGSQPQKLVAYQHN